MDYVIIELGGKQYRVEKGDSLLVDRLEAKEGAKLTPRPLLYRSDGETLLEAADLAKVKVEARVAEHVKGEKIRVFKYRPKKRYRRRAGHRSLLTRLEITGITGPAAGKPAARSEAGRGKPAAATEAAAGRAQPSRAKGEAKPAPAKKKDAAEERAKKAPARKPQRKPSRKA